MYRLKKPTNKQLSDFYQAYAPRIQYLMQELAKGILTIPISLGTKHAVHITLKVQNCSPTWFFLNKYSREVNLYKLLCGDWSEQLLIINEVCRQFPNLAWQNGMTKRDYDNGHYTIYGTDASGNKIVEDFHEIIHWLFVAQMYEGNDTVAPFVKKDFVVERDLKICPYCGRLPIDYAEVNGSMSKPYIDHFLPKSKYPFLAMSYMNLIPACNICNEKVNKGDLDPMLYPNHELRLLNPHNFYDKAVTFNYDYNQNGENNENNFKVLSVAENQFLEEGYLITMKLREFYSHQTLDVKDLYRRFTKNTNSVKKFLYRIGLNKRYLKNLEETTLGYTLNEDESPCRLMYKFRKDLFMQLKREYGL